MTYVPFNVSFPLSFTLHRSSWDLICSIGVFLLFCMSHLSNISLTMHMRYDDHLTDFSHIFTIHLSDFILLPIQYVVDVVPISRNC